jgi:hypothetical protein
MLMAAVVGCAESPQTSKYPADLSGRVTIAEKMVSVTNFVPTLNQGQIFWIVQISAKNVSYSQPITNYGWQIVANNVTCGTEIRDFPVDILNIASGQSGQSTYVFSVPLTIAVEDAQICYKGQEPSSFGKLSKVSTALAYDWNSKSVINVTPTPNTGGTNTYTLATPDRGILHLKLLKEWSGTGNKKFFFDVSPGPFVLDYYCSRTSSLGASFVMQGGKVDVGELHTVDFYSYKNEIYWEADQRGYAIVNKSGHFIVEIESSGCEWGVRVGTE